MLAVTTDDLNLAASRLELLRNHTSFGHLSNSLSLSISNFILPFRIQRLIISYILLLFHLSRTH